MHGSNEQDFAKSPLNQGFDYFYGLPLTNLKDFSDGGESVGTQAFSENTGFQ